jgi:hypothetical protein
MELVAKRPDTNAIGERLTSAVEAVSEAAGAFLQGASRRLGRATRRAGTAVARRWARREFGGDLVRMFTAYCPCGNATDADGRVMGVWWTEVEGDSVKVRAIHVENSGLRFTRSVGEFVPSRRVSRLLKLGLGRTLPAPADEHPPCACDRKLLGEGSTAGIAAGVLVNLSRFSGAEGPRRADVRACAQVLAAAFDAFRASLGPRALATGLDADKKTVALANVKEMRRRGRRRPGEKRAAPGRKRLGGSRRGALIPTQTAAELDDRHRAIRQAATRVNALE